MSERALSAPIWVTGPGLAGLDPAELTAVAARISPPPSPPEDVLPIAQTVLVAGAGAAALAAAAQAARLGHAVVLATPMASAQLGGTDDEPAELARLATELPAGVKTLARTELAWLTGAAGDFNATLQGLEGQTRLTCGAVVLAPPAAWRAEPAPAGLDPALCLSPASLDPASQAGTTERWRQVAVLAGTERPLTAAAFSRALAAGLALARRPHTQVTFFFGEARVAAEGGERLYRELRQAGALMARVEPGGLKAVEDGRALAWFDPLLNEEVSLAPDLVVTAEEASAEPPACLGNPVLWPAWKELAPEWPRLAGGLSLRSGLYVLGALRGTPAGDARLAEAAVAVGDLHERLSGFAPAPPIVRREACARCLTCVRTCPHGVPRYQEGRIVCAPAACVQCGLCAAQCPGQAIAPPGWTATALAEGLREGLALAPGPALVLLACARSGLAALAELAAEGHVWPAGLLILPLPCAGRAGDAPVLTALEAGAAGVLVASCHQGNCRSLAGGPAAAKAGEALAGRLAALGVEPGRVRTLGLASNQPRELAQALDDMFALIKE
jgi:coenzyme F420-reducing hydrogenase delta subunit/ferredoxin